MAWNWSWLLDWRFDCMLVSTACIVVGFVWRYYPSIIWGGQRPSSVTWFIWAALDVIAWVGMYFKHSVNGLIVASSIGASIAFVLAWKYGTAKWNLRDKLCLAGSVLAVGFWYYSGDANWGIVTSMAVLFLGAIPIALDTLNNPDGEDKVAWILFWVGAVLTLVSAPALTFEDVAQPVTFSIIESTMLYIVLVKPRQVARA